MVAQRTAPRAEVAGGERGGPRHLGIVSDTEHYIDQEGHVVGLGPLVRQFDQWAVLFDEVTICAPLREGPPPATHARYGSDRIKLLPVRRAGGRTLRAKLGLLATVPAWWRALRRLFATVDAVHVRCPNNISVVALLSARWMPRYRQAAFTGTWRGYPGEPATYRWQRQMLARRFRGPVAVYAAPEETTGHVIASFSPAITDAEWAEEAAGIERKIARLRAAPRLDRVRIASVGALSAGKNHELVIRALRQLVDDGLEAELAIAGAGPTEASLRRVAHELRITDRVRLLGAVPHATVRQLLRDSDVFVLASRMEGYGKVTIEALTHGAIPLLSDVGLARVLVGDGRRGRVFPSEDASALAAQLRQLADSPGEMAALVAEGRAYARTVTLERWREHLREMLEASWGVELRRSPGEAA